MNKIKYYLGIALITFTVISCNKDFLDVKPLDKISDAAVFNDPLLMEAYINDIYLGMGYGYTQCMMASLVDENLQNSAGFMCADFNNGSLSPSLNAVWEKDGNERTYVHFSWGQMFKNIRSCNIFFKNVVDTEIDDQSVVDAYTGEVHFLRAHYYHYLTSLFGGVPIIDKPQTLDDNLQVPRNTYKECVDFILTDLDAAISLLPEEPEMKGRISKGAAMAFKARVLLHAASEVHHNTSWAGGYAHPELVTYASADRNQMWRDARDAAKAVMDLGMYELYEAEPGANDSTAANYAQEFLEKESPEDILLRYFIADIEIEGVWWEYHPGEHHSPPGYDCWGQSNPTQNLVDDFEMSDGSKFDWSNPVHAANPYEDRDPRFYASIFYNGSRWRARPEGYRDRDPIGILQYWGKQVDVVEGDTIYEWGLDTRGTNTIKAHDGTYTGYNMRKFLDITVDVPLIRQDAPWKFIRYAEVLLNYAEACIELGEDAEARSAINQIRRRAGMPDIDAGLTGAELEAAYRHERRIELVFEEHRFWDVRRWMIGEEAYDITIYGVEPIYEYDPDTGTASTEVTYRRKTVEERSWHNKMYYLPIHLDEMNKNSALIQNPLYE